MSLTLRIGRTEYTIIWNLTSWRMWYWWPSYQCWRYSNKGVKKSAREPRKSYSRTRFGPFRFDVTRWRR